jgi:hypothetical protein
VRWALRGVGADAPIGSQSSEAGRPPKTVLKAASVAWPKAASASRAPLPTAHQEGASAPLSVVWADPDLQMKKRRAVEESNTDNRMVRCSCKRRGRARLWRPRRLRLGLDQ